MSAPATADGVWQWRPPEPAFARQTAWLIRLDGEDCRRFLHGQTSAAVETARPGQWIPSCCITPTGRMRALAEVLVDGEGAWLVISGGDGAAVHRALDQVLFPADRVRLGPPQPCWWLMPVAGPAESLRSETATADWRPLPAEGGWQLGEGRLGQALVLPNDGSPLPEDWAVRRPLTATELEHWRLQQGLPAAPAELNDDHNPFELGLATRVSLSKGCYVGQETLAKLATYDGVKQQLRRWHWQAAPGERPPRAGDGLEGEGGQRLGRITSMLELADGDRIGLAMVRRQALALDALQAAEAEGAGAARVTLSLPERFAPPPGRPGQGS
jgi:folate-binding protein YgfZ